VPRPARTDIRVDLGLAAACGVAAFVCLILPLPMRSNAAAALRSTVVRPLASLQERAELSRRAFLAHDEALRLTDSVTLRALRLTGVEDENERLRKLLGFAAAVKWGFVPAEALQGRGLGDATTITLSAGKRAGVEPLSPVVTPDGLVGMIERVDNSMSLAILWPHPDFRVSAMAADGSTFGIVTAHLGPGAERYLLELRSVPMRTQLKAGAVIVSSGLGGVYPRGIPIGTVLSELKTLEGWARSYLVRPVVKLPDITSVMILKPERVRAGLENVWQLGSGMDSAMKRVIVAGDSINAMVRAAAAAKAAALAPAPAPAPMVTPPASAPDTTRKRP
jgi:rod shape-determining protein MreC